MNNVRKTLIIVGLSLPLTTALLGNGTETETTSNNQDQAASSLQVNAHEVNSNQSSTEKLAEEKELLITKLLHYGLAPCNKACLTHINNKVDGLAADEIVDLVSSIKTHCDEKGILKFTSADVDRALEVQQKLPQIESQEGSLAIIGKTAKSFAFGALIVGGYYGIQSYAPLVEYVVKNYTK